MINPMQPTAISLMATSKGSLEDLYDVAKQHHSQYEETETNTARYGVEGNLKGIRNLADVVKVGRYFDYIPTDH